MSNEKKFEEEIIEEIIGDNPRLREFLKQHPEYIEKLKEIYKSSAPFSGSASKEEVPYHLKYFENQREVFKSDAPAIKSSGAGRVDLHQLPLPLVQKETYKSGAPLSSASSPISYQSGDGGGGSCFIATAAYGSCLSKDVEVLKQLRDKYLLMNPMGRVFVSLYYRYSPRIATYINEHTLMKKLARIGLCPLVQLSKWLSKEKS